MKNLTKLMTILTLGALLSSCSQYESSVKESQTPQAISQPPVITTPKSQPVTNKEEDKSMTAMLDDIYNSSPELNITLNDFVIEMNKFIAGSGLTPIIIERNKFYSKWGNIHIQGTSKTSNGKLVSLTFVTAYGATAEQKTAYLQIADHVIELVAHEPKKVHEALIANGSGTFADEIHSIDYSLSKLAIDDSYTLMIDSH